MSSRIPFKRPAENVGNATSRMNEHTGPVKRLARLTASEVACMCGGAPESDLVYVCTGAGVVHLGCPRCVTTQRQILRCRAHHECRVLHVGPLVTTLLQAPRRMAVFLWGLRVVPEEPWKEFVSAQILNARIPRANVQLGEERVVCSNRASTWTVGSPCFFARVQMTLSSTASQFRMTPVTWLPEWRGPHSARLVIEPGGYKYTWIMRPTEAEPAYDVARIELPHPPRGYWEYRVSISISPPVRVAATPP